MDAAVSIDDLNDALSLDIQGEDFDTVGGFIFDRLGKIPIPGDEIREDGFLVSVLTTTGRRIRKVKISRVSVPDGESESNDQSSEQAPL
jgi:CBS domain containing-hemolysin-like protein